MNSHTILLLLRPDAAQGLLHLKKSANQGARKEAGLLQMNDQQPEMVHFQRHPGGRGRCLPPAALSFA